MRELLMNARLICPLQNIDANGWLLIENGIIADSGNGTADSSIAADKITDCKGPDYWTELCRYARAVWLSGR